MSDKIRQEFRNNSDCYADTGRWQTDGSYVEGDVIQAMTEDGVVSLFNDLKKQIDELEKRLKECEPIDELAEYRQEYMSNYAVTINNIETYYCDTKDEVSKIIGKQSFGSEFEVYSPIGLDCDEFVPF